MHKSRLWAVALWVGLSLLPLFSEAAPQYVEGEVIVTFRSSATEATASASLDRRSLALSRRFGWLSAKRGRQTGVIRHATKTTTELIADLKDDPTVETVEPNYLRWISANPNDTRFNELWALRNTGQSANGTRGTSGSDVKYSDAWGLARSTNDEVVVGVIDTGVDYTHPDLAGNMWINRAESRANADEDNNGYVADYYGYDFAGISATIPHPPDPYDSGDHGTHVAGTIAAIGNNGAGIIGVNHRAKIMALKVSVDGEAISTEAVIDAVQYATLMKSRGVNIVALNASFGGSGNSTAERSAIQAAGNAGIIFCAAAGNDSENNDVNDTYPANYRLPNMIVVAATDQNDDLADFSNFGASRVDIAAPGDNILSLAPSTVTFKVGSLSYQTEGLTYSGVPTALSGKIVDCGYGGVGEFPASVSGNIALVQRGAPVGETLYFSDKVTNAMAAGATAIVLYNNVTDTTSYPFLGSVQNPGQWIPALSIFRNDGLAIKAALTAATTGSIVVTGSYQYLEGTSMATPHVAGAVAFAAMNFPNETVSRRIQRILGSVDIKASLTNKVASGGRLNLKNVADSNKNGIADWLEKSNANAPAITTGVTLPGGAVSSAYSLTMTGVGGSMPYTWAVISGSVPAGLTLSSAGLLQGTPTTPGSVTFALQIRDAVNATNAIMVTMDIAATPLSISSPAALSVGQVANAYSLPLSAVGGTPSYSWSLIDGALPAGLSLSASGALTGTPTVAGTSHFTVRVTDGSLATSEVAFTLVINPIPLVITSVSPLAVGALETPYSQSLNATGGTGAWTWSLSAGDLSPGLSLSEAGVVSGEPTAAGSFTFTAMVTDSTAVTQTKSFSLTIEETPVSITTDPVLIAGVKGLLYTRAFAATGGTPHYSWTRIAGTLPTGMTLTDAGVLSGKPTLAADFSFTLAATDSIGFVTTRAFTMRVTATYVRPVVNAIDLGATTVGMPYSNTVTATYYPKSFSIKNLPPGLKYAAATGVISGRPTAAGDFNVEIKATNSGGTSDVVISPLTVAGIPDGFIGSFTGIIERDDDANKALGGRLKLTVTAKGSYTAKVTVGATTKSAVGFLLDAAPHITTTVGDSELSLTFNNDDQLVSGYHGSARVHGWRSTWSRLNPASTRAGYYTVGLDLAKQADQGVAEIPQGSGYASFTVTPTGTLTVSGRVADGTAFTSAGFIGPAGEIAVYKSLYGNAGTVVGTLVLTEGAGQVLTENAVTGELTWSKPTTKPKAYPLAFGPTQLNVYGKYMAETATKGIAVGLPVSGAASLAFIGGGVEESNTKPNVSPFTYTATQTVDLPKAGLAGNLGKVTLTINTKSGLIGGSFTLSEPEPLLTRRVTFRGMVVRPVSGDSKAKGYFLLPQIPDPGKSISTSTILSGKVVIDQSGTE